MGKERHDEFHVSGYGTSVKAGINLTIFKYFTIEGGLKGGYINMQDIRTTAKSLQIMHHKNFSLQKPLFLLEEFLNVISISISNKNLLREIFLFI